MKRILFIVLLLCVAVSANSQVVSRTTSTTIRYENGGYPSAYIYHIPYDTAKDNTAIVKRFNYPLSGKYVVFGLDIIQLWDTLNANLVLEGSIDSTNWVGVDSIQTIPLGTVGRQQKVANLTAHPYGYWRLRLGTISMLFKGNILNPGSIRFFIQAFLGN